MQCRYASVTVAMAWQRDRPVDEGGMKERDAGAPANLLFPFPRWRDGHPLGLGAGTRRNLLGGPKSVLIAANHFITLFTFVMIPVSWVKEKAWAWVFTVFVIDN